MLKAYILKFIPPCITNIDVNINIYYNNIINVVNIVSVNSKFKIKIKKNVVNYNKI